MDAVPQMIDFLQLKDVSPPANKIKIGLISRRRKRFILNEYELADDLAAQGYEVELLPLESMTLYEQIRALRTLDVMVGIHGSALDNSVFLHPNSVMIQLLAYKLDHTITFPDTARMAKVTYLDWHLNNASLSVFHWDLFKQANTEKFNSMTKERLLEIGSLGADDREINMFWINQVCFVDLLYPTSLTYCD